MLQTVVAVILLCFGEQCELLKGYPLSFGSLEDCKGHIAEMTASAIPAVDAKGTIMTFCTEHFEIVEGTIMAL